MEATETKATYIFYHKSSINFFEGPNDFKRVY